MKLSPKTIKNILAITVVIGIYYICTAVFRLAIYVPFLVYIILIVGLLIIFRKDVFAIRGNLAINTGNNEVALKYLGKAVALNTRSSVANLNYAILKLRDGDWETALACLEKAENLNPTIMTSKNIMLTMGSTYWVKGDIKKAIEVLEEMREKYEYVNGNVLTTLGYMYLLDKDYSKSIELTNLAIEDMPESASAHDNMGQIYYQMNEFEKAKEFFNKALGFNDSLVDSLYFLGEIYELENNLEEAKKLIGRAKEAKITALNTVKKEQIEQKYNKLWEI